MLPRVQYDWDPKKNEFLKATRRVSFEAVIVHLGRGDVWRVADHPDQKHYPGQRLFFVVINGYVYIVPFEIRDEVIWLVTIIPSRKATKQYLQERTDEIE
jgi:uncharacterized DUF497 family protein